MLPPFGASMGTEQAEETPAPEVVPIEELSEGSIAAAEAEIEAEEDEWPTIA